MPAIDQHITDKYALYRGDCVEVLPDIPDESVGLTVYSPPFCGLYVHSSNPRDMSNVRSYQEFMEQYEFLVRQLHRVTLPGRISAVHCMDVPGAGNGETAKMGCGANAGTGLIDFPGDIIRLHEKCGFAYCGRRVIWKEPLGVRLRTMAKGLSHKQFTEDSTLCDIASGDYLLMFRRSGENKVPVIHTNGLTDYAGSRSVPKDLHQFRGYAGKQTENRYSHWIWRQYASCVWDDIRGCDGTEPKDGSIRAKGTLPYEESKDPDDEKHVHPLQLDVIERAVVMWSNEGDTVLTPFMGVGSEVFIPVNIGRNGIGIELKNSYYQQAIRNMALANRVSGQVDLFAQSPAPMNPTEDKPTPELTLEDVQRITVGEIEKSDTLLSLLYDLDLLPEQLEVKSKNWQRMVILVERWADLERQRDAARALLIESQTFIGGDWRNRRDALLAVQPEKGVAE